MCWQPAPGGAEISHENPTTSGTEVKLRLSLRSSGVARVRLGNFRTDTQRHRFVGDPLVSSDLDILNANTEAAKDREKFHGFPFTASLTQTGGEGRSARTWPFLSSVGGPPPIAIPFTSIFGVCHFSGSAERIAVHPSGQS